MLFPRSQPASPPRVVITGAGIVTAQGIGWKPNAQGFRAGKTAFRPVSLFDVSRQRVKVAAEVDLPAQLPPTRLGQRHLARLDRAGKMLLLAASEAWQQAGWDQQNADSTLPFVLGTTGGGIALYVQGGSARFDDVRVQPAGADDAVRSSLDGHTARFAGMIDVDSWAAPG
jgi:3-oxoacyl-[acyl-carrier-protein] synthase II